MRPSLARGYGVALLAALAAVAVYLPSLGNEFLNWDDNRYLHENPSIQSFDLELFRWAFTAFHVANWHPLTWLSHAVDYAVWGLSPAGHHLTNVLLHGAVTFVVVLLVRQLLQARRKRAGLAETAEEKRRELIAAGVVGALFGLHPVHVESVAWVAERKDLLCGLFYLLSVRAYVRHAEGDGGIGRQYGWALGWFVVALLSKPMAVSLPVVLLILDWYPLERLKSVETAKRLFVEKLPFVALSLLSSLITIVAQRAGKALQSVEAVPLDARLSVAAKAVIAYLWKMLFPFDLSPLYPYPKGVSFFSLEYILPAVLALAITVACVALARRRKLWGAAWGVYVVTLLPVLGIVQVGSQEMADRYMYLPSIAPFLLVGVGAAWGLERLDLSKKAVKGAGAALAVGVLAVLSYLTVEQIGIWKDSITFWSSVVRREPAKAAFPYVNLGTALWEAGRPAEAIESFNRAIALNAGLADAYYNRGIVFAGTGSLQQALDDYTKAIELNSGHYKAYVNRGIVYSGVGDFGRAFQDYGRALALNPGYYKTYLNRGAAYANAGMLDKAVEDWSRALALNPDSIEAYSNLGNLYGSTGMPDQALAYYNRAILINPNHPLPYFNRGILYTKMGDGIRASADFRRACGLGLKEACARAGAGAQRGI